MFKMTQEKNNDSDPGDSPCRAVNVLDSDSPKKNNGYRRDRNGQGPFGWLLSRLKGKQDTSLREALEEYIVEGELGEEESQSVSDHERSLISNVLKLRDLKIYDVMIPRADMIAIDIATSQKDLLSLLTEKQYSRLPVYKENLDHIVGTIHIKDILGCLAAGQKVEVENLVREAPIVSPSMYVLDLLLMMRQLSKHMVIVVDEFGGVDGLVTIGDVIESIVGEIEDEFDPQDEPEIVENNDGSIKIDGRYDIEEFEDIFGKIISDDEREDIDTIAGLIFALAGRVPARGEILTHPSGIVFEILDADLRRVHTVLIRKLPLQKKKYSA